MRHSSFNCLARISLVAVMGVGVAACNHHVAADVCRASQAPPASQDDTPQPTTAAARRRPDLSGVTRFGQASFYARWFAHREMADGAKMNPQGDNAASKTLPLGTTAKVTNIETGQSAVVSIQDRGPYVKGRIVDLSPATARKIGITHHLGIAEVKVAPISVPLPDGTTIPGSGAPPPPNPCGFGTPG